MDNFDFAACREYVKEQMALNKERCVNDIVQDYAVMHHREECLENVGDVTNQLKRITRILGAMLVKKLIDEVDDDETREILQELEDLL